MACEECDKNRAQFGSIHRIGEPCDICDDTGTDYIGRPCRHCNPHPKATDAD